MNNAKVEVSYDFFKKSVIGIFELAQEHNLLTREELGQIGELCLKAIYRGDKKESKQ